MMLGRLDGPLHLVLEHTTGAAPFETTLQNGRLGCMVI
jgi:hypothetical protein